MAKAQAVETKVGDAIIRKGGDPRPGLSDFDTWLQTLLHKKGFPQGRVHLYGSDAGFCARRNVLLHHNSWVVSETTPASNAYMSIGVALEEMLMKGMKEKGVLIAWNRYLIQNPYVKVRGKMDLIFLDPNEQVTLMEVKTCGALPTEPKPTHLAQAQTYSALSGLRNVVLTYISRQVNLPGEFGPQTALRTFVVDTSEEALRSRLEVALKSDRLAKQGILPPLPAHFRKHTECHTCEFRDLFCWQERPGLAPKGVDGLPIQKGKLRDKSELPLPSASLDQLLHLDASIQEDLDEMVSQLHYREVQTLLDLTSIDDMERDVWRRLNQIYQEKEGRL